MDENQDIIEVKPEPTKEEKMKKAYTRCGFGLMAMYGVASVISTLLMSFFAGVGTVFLFLNEEIVEIIRSSEKFNFSEALGIILEDPMFAMCLIVGIVLGTGIGFFVGGLILKKIMPKPEEIIQKKNLSLGQFLLVVMIAYGLWGVGVFVGNAPSFFYEVNSNNLLQLFPGKTLIPYYIYAMIGAPIIEEFIFRKVMMDSLHKYGQTVAAFVSGLTFGLIHGNSGQFIFAFMLGLLFATVYMKTGKVIYTIILHAIINTTATIPNIISAFTDGRLDVELSNYLFVFIAIMGLLGLAFMIVFRNNDILILQKPECQDANKLVFKNAGMILCIVLGLVQLVSTDLLGVLVDLLRKGNPLALLSILPTGLTIAMTIVLVKTIGTHSQVPKAEIE